ncbi:hypothetical protein PF005_g5080 [Phytophthora fragariae]|uniref:TKL protein kinase n=1 Tax=Phytophthora fragariae TaxID=53985 RepID=A0A6A3T3I5_9STRA|nr:hypothetical protein PF003_g3763 [Phytophthora fragariae]KAE8944869.1 hypothetical protein PF009_g5472 [Phytophthora fragariae]KAE9012887.1 hypothetical protein PF011_g8709 [Phytophthora fragariae]KAE9115805.1 hypothetical protein PF010_g9204 [Phytophthora fragariae]KAE9128907.1 hypothetical protein PF007_g5110 [Phytophthora fragariae]
MLGQVLLLVVAAQAFGVLVTEAKYAVQATYLSDSCGETPYAVTVWLNETCATSSCDSFDQFEGSRDVNANMMTTDCASDYEQVLEVMRAKFGSSPYLLQMLHTDENCTEFSMAFGYPAMGACVGAYNESDGLYAVASLFTNSSASLTLYMERTCFSNQKYMSTFVDKEALASHSCSIDWFRWYSSNDVKPDSGAPISTAGSSKSLSSGSIVGIGLGAFGFAIVFVVAIVLRRR